MRILVTSALPYANGDIHLGHLAGCYLPADIYVRYQKSRKRDCIHICGTDEHGVPIIIAALEKKCSPKEVIDYYYERIKKAFKDFGIIFDNFSRTSLPLHHKISQEFFLKIYEKGYIYKKEVIQFYCENCKLFLADRYVYGTCPFCQNPKARGDQCEICGRWLEPFQLISPKCKICNNPPVEKKTFHYFFALSKLQEKLKEWLLKKDYWKDNVKKFSLGLLNQGLEDRAISRDLPWGVKIPLEEAENKVLYVWFDAPIGYISSTIEWAEKNNKGDLWKEYWLNPETRLIHFIGKDNIIFHALIWPAMLMAHGDYILPYHIPANEFLNLEGRKLSTSENWAVWLIDYLKEFPPDMLRYTLASNLPETSDIDFTWKDFQIKANNELADILGNFVNRVLLFIKRNLKGKVPEDWELANEVLETIKEVKIRTENFIENFEIKNGLKELMKLPSFGNQYFDYQAPWQSVKSDLKKCEKTIANCLILIKSIEVLFRPYLPFTCEKIRNFLDLEKFEWDDVLEKEFLLRKPILKEVEILFNKIPNEKIELQLKKLKGGKMEITIEDFKKLDLRVGRVLNCERVKGTDKLLVFEIDIGNELRQIVAGIGNTYEPKDLIGKNVIVVCNLQPIKIKGIESNGMILAVGEEKAIAILTTDKDVPPGSIVR